MNLVRWANWESFGKLVDLFDLGKLGKLFDLGELVGQMSPNLVISLMPQNQKVTRSPILLLWTANNMPCERGLAERVGVY